MVKPMELEMAMQWGWMWEPDSVARRAKLWAGDLVIWMDQM